MKIRNIYLSPAEYSSLKYLFTCQKKEILQSVRKCKYWIRHLPVNPFHINECRVIFAVCPSFCSFSEQVSRNPRRASKRVSRLHLSLTQYNQKRTHNFVNTHSRRALRLHLLLYMHTGWGVRRARCHGSCSGGQTGAGRSSNALLRSWRMRSWMKSRR